MVSSMAETQSNEIEQPQRYNLVKIEQQWRARWDPDA